MNIEYADYCHACGRKLVGREWTTEDLRQSVEHAHSRLDEGRATAGRAASAAREAASKADHVAQQARDAAGVAKQSLEKASRGTHGPGSSTSLRRSRSKAEAPKKKSSCCGCFVFLAFIALWLLISNREAAMELFEAVAQLAR